jgi:hypothetical protein
LIPKIDQITSKSCQSFQNHYLSFMKHVYQIFRGIWTSFKGNLSNCSPIISSFHYYQIF